MNKSPVKPYPFKRTYDKCKKSYEWRLKIHEAHIKRHLKNKGICRICRKNITPEEAVKWALKENKWECLKCSRARSIKKNLRYRIELFKEYGNKCVCCGETNLEFLTIDHINGDGHIQRQEYKITYGKQLNYYNWLKQQGYPKDNYRILCWNCNCARAKYGYCPHEKIKMEITV